MPTALVTGFGPFPGVVANASGALARAIDGARLGPWRVAGRCLDTSWVRAWPMLEAAVREVRPTALVMLGVAPRDQVELEWVARNQAAVRPDCDGALPAAEILGDGPAELATTLPAVAGCGVSRDAGSYLCNAVFYLAQLHLTGVPHRGFVHLPHEGLWPGLRIVGRLLRSLPVGDEHGVADAGRADCGVLLR